MLSTFLLVGSAKQLFLLIEIMAGVHWFVLVVLQAQQAFGLEFLKHQSTLPYQTTIEPEGFQKQIVMCRGVAWEGC